MALPPTVADLRLRSPLLKATYPLSDPVDPEVEAQLEVIKDESVSMIQSWTARNLDPAHPENCASAYASSCEELPVGMIAIALRAVALLGEMIAVSSTVRLARQRGGRLRLRGFSAGPYSEQYWDPGMVRGGGAGRPVFVDDPDLNDLIWAMATDEAKATLILQTTGQQKPGAAVQSFDWRGRRVVDQRISSARSRRGF